MILELNTWACRSGVLMMVVELDQRPFGGQSKNFGGEQAARTAAAADRTGHALLHTLYQQNLESYHYFLQRYALDLVKNQDGAVVVVGHGHCASKTGEWFISKPRYRLGDWRGRRINISSP